MKKILFSILLLTNWNVFSQIGVYTEKPTETFHLNGTVRISELPENSSLDAIYTKPDGTASETKNQSFNATRTVVADLNGVLGTIEGIPRYISKSEYKHVATVTNDYTDAIQLEVGCLKLILDPYDSGGETYMTLKGQIIPSCTNAPAIWTVAVETGGADVGGAQQQHARVNLTSTAPTDFTHFFHRIRYSPLMSGRIALVDLKQVYEFTYYGNRNSDGTTYEISLFLNRLY